MNALLWAGLVASAAGTVVAVCAVGRTSTALRHSGTGLAASGLTLLLAGLWMSGAVSGVVKTAATMILVVAGTAGLYRIDTRSRMRAGTDDTGDSNGQTDAPGR